MNSFENLEKEKPKENIYTNGNVECIYGELPDSYIVIVKKTIDSFAPYIDHKILIQILDFAKHNPGFHMTMNREIRELDGERDRMSINSDFWDKSKLGDFLLHELGHTIECQLDKIANENNIDLFDRSSKREVPLKDWQIREIQADLLVAFVLEPEYFKNNLNSSTLKNTYEVFEKIFEGNNFSELREIFKIENNKYKIEAEEQYKLGKINKPAWLEDNYIKEPLYLRAFDQDVADRYLKQFDQLENKYRKIK
ncbi:MAG: hypothetical protein WCX88_01100 [Patescibacteria group bacterium]